MSIYYNVLKDIHIYYDALKDMIKRYDKDKTFPMKAFI